LIDTEAPEPFEIIVDNEGDSTNPTPILRFNTTDSLSGIEYYEVKIGEGDRVPITRADVEHNPYKMPLQGLGKHTIVVEALDKANNLTSATTDIVIEPIEQPIITDFPESVTTGDTLTIKGTSLYPNAIVTVFVKKEGKEVKAKDVNTDGEGDWVFVSDKISQKGTYQVWAQITDNRGARSNPTDKITIATLPSTLIRIGGAAIGYLVIIAILAILIGVIFYIWYRISLWRKRIKKETKEAERALGLAFNTLRKEVEEQVRKLNGRPTLSKNEKRIRNELKKVLEAAEKDIRKEIRDIKKELK